MTDIPIDAQPIANLAFREARAEGCNCDPHIVITPTIESPFWRAVVEHDEWCAVIVRLRRAGAPLDPPREN